MQANDNVARLLDSITGIRAEIAAHPLYSLMQTRDDLRVFMEYHVFAVWDFMSLLKALQRTVTCQELPWRPVGRAQTRRLVNEIVLEEESDCIDGVAIGHFELYLKAMDEVGASTVAIHRLLELVEDGVDLDTALDRSGAPDASAAFVRATFDTIDLARPHVIASAFTFGRESSIPSMFRGLGETVGRQRGGLPVFLGYIERHCQLDEEDHGPKAIEMITQICGEREENWREATETAHVALQARMGLWDAIAADLAHARGAGEPELAEVA